MTARIAHRGLDGITKWTDGPVGLGHLQRFVTPESLRERQPTVDADGTVVVADLRLDDRANLAHSLGLPRAIVDGESSPTDVELLLRAYRKWGDDTPKHLMGDFAFAIWRPSDNSLFAAVDQFGARTLYTHHAPGRLFAFASEAKAILAIPGVPDTLDKRRLAHFLTGARVELDRSIFQAIQNVPPAHALRVDRGGVRVWQYYELAAATGLGPLSGTEGVEAFRERFEHSVRDRTRSAFPVGSQLSGGLDSSAVSIVARDAVAEAGNAPLHTYTLTFDATPSSDEREYAQAVLDLGGFEPHFVDADPLSPLGNLKEVYEILDTNLVGGTQHQSWALLQSAQKSGVRVVLDGLDGDSVIDHGDDLISEAARRGDWKSYMRMSHDISKRYAGADHLQDFEEQLSTTTGVFGQHGWPVLYEQARTGSRIRFLWNLNNAGKYAGVIRSDALRKLGRTLLRPRFRARRMSTTLRTAAPSLINEQFAASVDVPLRPDVFGVDKSSNALPFRERQRQFLTAPHVLGAVQPGAHLAAALGLELAHPFFDVRVVELCLALPPEQSFHAGWTRYVLRSAFDERLPQSVAWRIGKAKMTYAVERAIRLFDEPRLHEIARDPGWLDAYLDMDTFRRFASPDRPLTELEVTHLAWISTAITWLRRQWPDGPDAPSRFTHLRPE